jgi:hypothetical protein
MLNYVTILILQHSLKTTRDRVEGGNFTATELPN